MKICILMPAHWSSRLGGAEIQVRYLIRHLRKTTTHDVSVVCRHSTMSEDEGVPIHRIRSPSHLARFTYMLDYPSVQRLLRNIDPDVIYTRVGSPLVGFAAQHCKRHRTSLIHHIARLDDVLPRAQLPPRNMLRNWERSLYEHGLRQANAVIAQATYQAVLLKQHFDRDATVIPNYHPAPQLVAAKDQPPRLVLWIANIKPAKRPEAFITLAERCRTLPDIKFMMVGALSDPRYASMIAKAQQMENFTYVGSAPLEDVNRLVESAHIVVNTSVALGEGFPNTFIQAWLRRTPVVSLEVNPDSLLSDGRLGLCSRNSLETFICDVQSLLLDPGRLDRMGEFDRQHALNTYGVDNLTSILNLMEQSPTHGSG